ncbi:MAG: hypothetical protein P4L64_00280 [Caulobacteraceae bacterium]|nr:hypothetical protein [Caulobacteraceae bacterium]
MRDIGVSKESVVALLNLLGELEGHLEHNEDPDLAELKFTVGAALAALYRASAERRIGALQSEGAPTRH